MKKIIFVLISFIGFIHMNAQEQPTLSPIVFIYDASGSMWGEMQGQTKMEIAAAVLTASVNSLPENQNIGFVAYGHRKKGDCNDVEFMVDIDNGSKSAVIQSIKEIKPLGKTPLAYSAIQVIDKLRQSKRKATIILVTDGIESCNGNICDVIKAAKSEGIDFKLHIIGFGIKDGETDQLKCAAAAGNGNYYDAQDARGLSDVLKAATKVTVDEPDGNVTIYASKNGVAIDAHVKAYDILNKREPIVTRTYQDTASFYLPPSTYNLEVLPLEGTDVDMITVSNLESFEDKTVHKAISFDGGRLGINTTNNEQHWDCIVKIIDQTGKVKASVRTYNVPKEVEVNPGNYKVTIQALGSLEGMDTYAEFENVIIESGNLTPILHDFKTGKFEIFTKVDGENIDAVVTIKELNSGTRVGGSRTYLQGAKFLLNTGTYEVKVQPLSGHKGKTIQTFTIDIAQGQLTSKVVDF